MADLPVDRLLDRIQSDMLKAGARDVSRDATSARASLVGCGYRSCC